MKRLGIEVKQSGFVTNEKGKLTIRIQEKREVQKWKKTI